MKIAIYPGSFDPITLGHLDVLKDGAQMFDKVIITVSNNISKHSLLSVEERLNIIKQCVKDIPNVEVDSFNGLTVEYAKSKNATILLRGLRAVSDFEYEMQLSQTNRSLNKNIKTVFLITKPEYNFISSSTVKEILKNHGDISKFVSKPVNDYLTEKFANEKL